MMGNGKGKLQAVSCHHRELVNTHVAAAAVLSQLQTRHIQEELNSTKSPSQPRLSLSRVLLHTVAHSSQP